MFTGCGLAVDMGNNLQATLGSLVARGEISVTVNSALESMFSIVGKSRGWVGNTGITVGFSEL
jgi:hypothetical protein